MTILHFSVHFLRFLWQSDNYLAKMLKKNPSFNKNYIQIIVIVYQTFIAILAIFPLISLSDIVSNLAIYPLISQ